MQSRSGSGVTVPYRNGAGTDASNRVRVSQHRALRGLVRTDVGLSYRPQFASSKQDRRLFCSELDLKQRGVMWSATPTERYVSSRPPVIPNKPLCIDQLSSCHLKALVSVAGG